MNIRPAMPTDPEVLLDNWLRSVRATHAFVSGEAIQSFIPLARDYLASTWPGFRVRYADSGQFVEFMGLSGSKVDVLFLAPEFRRRGGGRRIRRLRPLGAG